MMSLEEELEAQLDALESRKETTTAEVDVDLRELKALLKIDFEVFIDLFLSDSLDMEVPQFHHEIWGLMTDEHKERILLAIPRDHAKTTLAKLSVVWHYVYSPYRFCVYLSNTNPIAKGACKDIVDFLKHPNFTKVYGKVRFTKESENESLWQFEIPLKRTDGSIFYKKCILRAVGQGQQMRGINIDNQRPDITVVDDVEDNDNTASEFQQKKLDKWIFGPFLKALARKKKIIWLGNMLSKTSLLARLSRSPRWNPVVFGCLVKDTITGLLEPLWPGKWTVEALKEDLAEYKSNGLIETWMCEMMNMPGHGVNGFTADQINYVPAPNPDQILAAFISVDPAFGQNEENDESSIAVHVILEEGPPVTVAISHGRWNETTLFERILEQAIYWGAWTWGIEANAAQKLLITLFTMMLATKRLNHHVEMLPLISGKGDPKIARIKAWVALMQSGEWGLYEGDVDATTQLLDYNAKATSKHDDIIDSCAYGPIMTEQYLPLIMAQAAGQRFDESTISRYGAEVASV